MKKILLSFCGWMATIGLFAQFNASKYIYMEENQTEAVKRTCWILRFGCGTSTFVGLYDEGLTEIFGYNVSAEFHVNFGPFYLGGYAGLGNRGYKDGAIDVDVRMARDIEEKYMAHNIQSGPVIGFLIPICGRRNPLRLDLHGGPYISCDYAGYSDDSKKLYYGKKGAIMLDEQKVKKSIYRIKHYQYIDAGINLCVGFWVNKDVCLDFMYQKGFVSDLNYEREFGSDRGIGASNFLIRIGCTL